MLKHKLSKLQAVMACGFSLFLVLSSCFTSCKTTPVAVTEVNPLDFLDNNSSFYMRVPSSIDPQLIQRMIQGSVKGISEGDSKKIADRIDTVYIGMKKSRKSVDFQISSLCNFPKVAVASAFTKKNGWNSAKLSLAGADGKDVSYTVYENQGLLASFPSVNVACLGRSVPDMVEKYHFLSQKMNSESNVPLLSDVRNWLCYEDDIPDNQVRFFAAAPQSFLTTLTGANLNFKLIYVRGLLENDPKNENQYLMQLEFEFRDHRVVPAAKAMLSVAFGLTDSDVTMESDTHLTISKIKINKQQLYKILVI